MTLPLRERRRQQTARDIQRATLDLAAAKGFENVTTEAIAEAAGISARTFFNYYTNKEAASVGLPPKFSEAARAALREGQGALEPDLRRFIDAHLADIAAEADVIHRLRPVLRSSAQVRWLLDQHLLELRGDLAACLEPRLAGQEHGVAAALAGWALHAAGQAIDRWLEGHAATLPEAMASVWRTERLAAALIAFPARPA
mgnify:CR=1 FL=1